MKAKALVLALVAVIMVMLVGNNAYALSTQQVIYLRVTVVGRLSLDLEDEWLHRNMHKPEAEAFSELKESGVQVDKLVRNNEALWLFTKTE